VQVFPEVEAQPLHAAKIELASGVAVRTTSVAGVVFGIAAVQPVATPEVQAIPPPVTVPTPVPLVLTESGQVLGWNVA
jgi:hypothetical protein